MIKEEITDSNIVLAASTPNVGSDVFADKSDDELAGEAEVLRGRIAQAVRFSHPNPDLPQWRKSLSAIEDELSKRKTSS